MTAIRWDRATAEDLLTTLWDEWRNDGSLLDDRDSVLDWITDHIDGELKQQFPDYVSIINPD